MKAFSFLKVCLVCSMSLCQDLISCIDLFPLVKNWLLRLPWHNDRSLPELLWRFNNQKLSSYDPLTLVKRALPSSVPIKVTEILPRFKDG